MILQRTDFARADRPTRRVSSIQAARACGVGQSRPAGWGYVDAVPAEDFDVVPYDARWPEVFDAERGRLLKVLRPWLRGDVEHIGSTSVAELPAKPIIDMLAGVQDLDAAAEAVPALTAMGYQAGSHRPHEAIWLFAPAGAAPPERSFHLHLTEVGSDLWLERLTFRNALRADPELTRAYGRLKQLLARQGLGLVEYTDRKRDFVAAVLAGAGVRLQPKEPGASADS